MIARLSAADVSAIQARLAHERKSPGRARREDIRRALCAAYQALGLSCPEVIWLQSPAAAEFAYGLARETIPGWFLARRINPDLFTFDPEIPETFWSALRASLTRAGRVELVEALRTRASIAEEILWRIEAYTPLTVRAQVQHFWPKAGKLEFGYEYSCWHSLIHESAALAITGETLFDLWAGWIGRRPDCRRPGPDAAPFFHAIRILSRNAAVWYPLCGIAVVVENPAIRRFRDGMLHSHQRPAVVWPDGVRSWFLNGAHVPRWLVQTSDRELDAARLLQESNAEVRREMVRKIGIDRVCHELDTECVDRQGDYELLLLRLETDSADRAHPGQGPEDHAAYGAPWDTVPGLVEPPTPRRLYLKMKNPSTGTCHVEGVHPLCRSVAEALAWRNGTHESPVALT